MAELRQDPKSSDGLISVWLGPEFLKGREFGFFLYNHKSYSGKVLNMYDKELYFEKIFEQQIVERLLLDFQFLDFVAQYKKIQLNMQHFQPAKAPLQKRRQRAVRNI